MSNLAAALSFVQRGWAVLPLHWWTGATCSCRNPKCESPAKHPIARLTPKGLKQATHNVQIVQDWWSQFPDANIGIATGEVSGIVVLDIDPENGGDQSAKELIRQHGDYTGTLHAYTGSGGSHYYYAHPGFEVRNSAGQIGEGVDIRGDGGYVVAPPSSHASGECYEWNDPDQMLLPLPAWMVPRSLSVTARAQQQAPRHVAEGRRNEQLTAWAGAMRRRGAEEGELFSMLQVLNSSRCVPPLSEREVERIAHSISRYEPDEVIGADPLHLVQQSENPRTFSLSSVLHDTVRLVEDRFKSGGGLPGITTGFDELDDYLLGWEPSQLYVLGARPAMGKTAIALQMAITAASTTRVQIFSVEMSKEALALRALAGRSGIDGRNLRRGRFGEDAWPLIVNAAANLSTADLWLNDDSGITEEGMRRVLDGCEDRPGLIVVDYLQIMQAARRTNSDTEKVSEISMGLKRIAKDYAAPLIALSQLSRGVEGRADKRPGLQDLRQSGQIEQDADAVLFIHRPEYYGETHMLMGGEQLETRGLTEIIIAKQRNGPLGKVLLQMDAATTSFRPYRKGGNVFAQPAEIPF